MRLLATVIGIVCAALVIVGCGGGSDDTLSKAEFIKQGDAICKKASTKREAAVVAAVRSEDPGDKHGIAFSEKTIIEAGIPPLTQMTDELADLGEPDPGAEEAAAVVEAYKAGVASMEDDPLGTLRGSNKSFAEATKLAAEFGLKACSQL
ncbi:MAG: hypothetical protein JJE35_01800 [Thermoleophilia bacterium]|nr:hypothetical protein [Thermoleophilia bacterium]